MEKERGLVCPRCQQCRWRVTHTERLHGTIRRRRTCRSCGYRLVTWERSTLADRAARQRQSDAE